MARRIDTVAELLREHLEWRRCTECPAVWWGMPSCKFCGAQGEPVDEDIETLLLEAANNAGSTLPN